MYYILFRFKEPSILIYRCTIILIFFIISISSPVFALNNFSKNTPDQQKNIISKIILAIKKAPSKHPSKKFLKDISAPYNIKNIRDAKKNSLLHILFNNNNLKGLQFLLDCGFDPNLQNALGLTVLDLAIINNNSKAFLLILKYHPNLEIKDTLGRTPLYFAVLNNQVKNAQTLLSHKAKIDAEDINGLSPLFAGVQNKNLAIVSFLLKNGANVNKRNKLRKTPLHFATQNHDQKMIQLLLSHGANVNARDQIVTAPSTPLDIAEQTPNEFSITNVQEKIRQTLLDAGAKNAKPFYKDTLSLSMFYGFGQPFHNRVKHSDEPVGVSYLGTRLTYYVNPDLSLFWSYGYGASSDSSFKNYHIIKAPGALVGIQEIFSFFSTSYVKEMNGPAKGFYYALLAASAFIPEGISWNIYLPTSQWLSFSLDISWASANIIIPKSSAIAKDFPLNVEINGMIGGRINVLLGENFNLNFALDMGFSYTSIEFVWDTQVSIAWLF